MFTSSAKQYASKIVPLLDPTGTLIKGMLTREDCTPLKGYLVKELRSIEGIQKEDVIAIDDKATSFAFDFDNMICIKPFYGANDDKELIIIETFLKKVYNCKDVRPFIYDFSGIQYLYEKYFEHMYQNS